MKNSGVSVKITQLLLAFLVMHNLYVAGIATAQDRDFTPPVYAEGEGTERGVTAEQLEKLRPWAMGPVRMLERIEKQVSVLRDEQKPEFLLNSIESYVRDNSLDQGQLYVRYILNRGALIATMVRQQYTDCGQGCYYTMIRLLQESFKMAKDYAPKDQKLLQASSPNSDEQKRFAVFGVEYFRMLSKVNQSTLHSKAQLEISIAAIELLQWDLHRDLEKNTYAGLIFDLQTTLSMMKPLLESSKPSDYIRGQRMFYGLKAEVEGRLNEIKSTPFVSQVSSNWARKFAAGADFKRAASWKAHDGLVSSVAIQGDYIVSGSWDSTIKVWQLSGENTKPIKTLEGHDTLVRSVAIQGDYIVSGSWDSTIKVWQLSGENTKPIKTLEGHRDWVSSVAIQGDYIVSGSVDKTIKVWKLSEENTEPIKTFKGHDDYVHSVAIQGDYIVSGSSDNTIKVWQLSEENTEPIKSFKAHDSAVLSVAIQGDTVISGSSAGWIARWELSK